MVPFSGSLKIDRQAVVSIYSVLHTYILLIVSTIIVARHIMSIIIFTHSLFDYACTPLACTRD